MLNITNICFWCRFDGFVHTVDDLFENHKKISLCFLCDRQSKAVHSDHPLSADIPLSGSRSARNKAVKLANLGFEIATKPVLNTYFEMVPLPLS